MSFLAVNGVTSPTIEVSFDYQNDPTSATQTWTDITPYVVSYSREPVRTNEFDQPGPAQASITLRNDDNRFTPDNATGPYFGGLKKFGRLRVRAQWAGVTYNRFWGYVLDWPQSWAQAGQDQTVTLTVQDALSPLTTIDLYGLTFPSQKSGATLQSILRVLGPNITASLDTGISTIDQFGPMPTSSYAMSSIQNVAATENGICFADGGGTIRFHDRAHRLVNNTSSAGTIGDGLGAEIAYIDPQPQFGDLWPVVTITPNGGTPVVSTAGAAYTLDYKTQTLLSTPKLYWKMDESLGAGTALDSSGNGLTGTYGSGVTLGGAGAISGETSASFNGTANSYVLAGTYSPFVVGSKRTFVGWANKSNNTFSQYLFGGGTDASAGLDVSNTNGIAVGGRVVWVAGNNVVWDDAWPGINQWVHVAITYDDATRRAELFINGVSKGAQTVPTSGYTGTAGVLQVGNRQSTHSAPFFGSIDEFSVFEYVMSAAAIAGLATATAPAATGSYFAQRLNYPTGGTYLVSGPAEAQGAADYLATRYSNPMTRINGATLIGAANTSQWSTILGLDTSSRVVFKRRLENGQTVALNQFVEGYGDDVTIGRDWRVNVPLSPADLNTYWQLGTTGFAELGTNTRLFY